MEKRQMILILGVLFIGIIIIQQRMTGQATDRILGRVIAEQDDTATTEPEQIDAVWSDEESPPEPIQFTQRQPLPPPPPTCNTRIVPTSTGLNPMRNAQIATHASSGGPVAEDYFVYYADDQSFGKFGVYGAGNDDKFATPDDTGDRIIQGVGPNNRWYPYNFYITTTRGLIAYSMAQSVISPGNSPQYIFVKKPGPDGYFGLGNDDLTFVAAVTPPGTTLQTIGSFNGNALDIVENGIAYSLYANTNPTDVYIIRQDFGADGTPGNSDDVFAIMNQNHPIGRIGFGFFQTSTTGVTTFQGDARPYPDIATWFTGPVPSGGLYQHFVGAGGINEEAGQLAYDGSFAITISTSPPNSPPGQGTNLVNLYDLRAGLANIPTPTMLSLPRPSTVPQNYIGPLISAVDIDGPYFRNGQTVTATLDVNYRFIDLTTSRSIWLNYYRNTGADANFNNDDYVSVCTINLAQYYTIAQMQVKEETTLFIGNINNQYGIHVLDSL